MSIDEKYQGKYLSACTRWSAWDYGSNAAYFFTICVASRAHDFGEISNGIMQLTPLGQTSQDCWQDIPDHFTFVIVGAFVVIPDHVHGVVVIDKPVMGIVANKNQFGIQSQNLASIIREYKIE